MTKARWRIAAAAALLLLAFALLWRGCFRGGDRRLARSTIIRSNPYQCQACGHTFDLDYATAEKYIRAGRVKSPPDGLRVFPCPACGKIAAECVMDYGDLEQGDEKR